MEVVDRQHEICEESGELKAHTPVAGKGQVVLADLERDADPDFANYDDRVLPAVSLARDRPATEHRLLFARVKPGKFFSTPMP